MELLCAGTAAIDAKIMNSIDDFQVLNAIGKCSVSCRVAWNFLCETSAAYSQNEVITLRNY